MPFHAEAARRTPIVDRSDVVVVGGGPAGVAAALAAAEVGASVRLLEVQGQLGGVWTSGLLTTILDAGDKHGVMRRIIHRLGERGGVGPAHHSGVPCDAEHLKLVLEQECLAAGVRVRLHTRLVGAGCDRDGGLAVAVTESRSGREAFTAAAFVDASGDGDLAAHAGCGFDLGRPIEGAGAAGAERAGECQPLSLIGVVAGIDRAAAAPCLDRERYPPMTVKRALLAELERAGASPSYGHPTIIPLPGGLFMWMCNHEYGVSALDAQAISDATLRARAELHRQVDALRALGGAWRDLHLVATGSQIGVREGRRIHGRVQVTADDLAAGRRHPDAVCRVNFGVDVHAPDPSRSTTFDSGSQVRARPYDIPYGAIVARDVDGLLLAGRCISGDFIAHSSYRVTGNSVALGEAAGLAAAVAARTGSRPHELDWCRDVAPEQEALHRRLAGLVVDERLFATAH